MAQHLTDAVVKRLPLPATGSKIHWDAMPGFGARVTAAGARSFVLRYRVRGSQRDRTFTIGGCSDWATTAARAEAKRLRQLIDQGGDPLGDLEAVREAPTVAQLIDRFVKEHLPRLRASSQADYLRMLEGWVRPHFGKHLKVADVTYELVDALHRKITRAGSPYRANRVVAVVSKLFSLSIKWNMRGTNPCKGIEKIVSTTAGATSALRSLPA